MAGGRPSIYTKKLGDSICERLACGESMRAVCRDEGMPALSSVFKWIREDEEFSQQYDKAKEESADALTEDMLDIADNQVTKPLIDDNGDPVIINGEAIFTIDSISVQHAKLRIDIRKWAASKLKPKKYGDRIINDVNLKNNITAEDLTDEQLASIAATGSKGAD